MISPWACLPCAPACSASSIPPNGRPAAAAKARPTPPWFCCNPACGWFSSPLPWPLASGLPRRGRCPEHAGGHICWLCSSLSCSCCIFAARSSELAANGTSHPTAGFGRGTGLGWQRLPDRLHAQEFTITAPRTLERCGLGPAGLRRHPDHQEPAAAAGRWKGTALTTSAMLTSESYSRKPKS